MPPIVAVELALEREAGAVREAEGSEGAGGSWGQ